MPAIEGSARSLVELAGRHGGSVDEAAREVSIRGVMPLELGTSSDLCPLLSRRHLKAALCSPAVLLVDEAFASLVPAGRRWLHPHAGWALASVLEELEPVRSTKRDPTARVDPGADVASDVRLGAGAVVMSGVRIGAGSVIEPHAVIYGGVTLGQRVHVGAGSVLGRPGFGWASGPHGAMKRVPQLGGVTVHDDVEIGPLCTVDAGTLAPTVLERGVRLDAHVHVGHNVVMGAESLVAAQSGFAGSVRLGVRVRVGGQAGVADHVHVGDGAQIAAKAGVIGDIAAGRAVAGYPAVERARWLRAIARMLAGAGGHPARPEQERKR